MRSIQSGEERAALSGLSGDGHIFIL